MDGVQSENFNVEVLYNGIARTFHVKVSELVRSLLEQAIRVFGIQQNTHLLALFTPPPENRELPDNVTIGAAGVYPHEKLNLRPSAVRGGIW